MLLLVGLGNPTPDSENNRHNIGFKIIDAINKKFGLSKQKPKFKGLLTTGNVGNQKVYAIKPLTFMNNSGICIRELIEYFKIDAEDVIVFHDDLDVEFGDFVLQNFDEDEMLGLEKITNNITDSISILIDKKLDLFSSTVNNK
jgi:PTH1 family peptidyl-tRNA hydrolase